MNKRLSILCILLIGAFLIGCTQSQSGYATYNQPQAQPQGGQYIGGGCGVAPSGNYENTGIGALNSRNSVL